MALRVLSVVLPALLIFTVAVNSARRGTWTTRNQGTARIIDGKPAKVGQFPHQANIKAENLNTGRKFDFGGSLISRRAVLTNGWCVTMFNKWTIKLGGIHRTEHEDTAWTTVTQWALAHPDYNSNTSHANVAIIYLLDDAPLSDFIKPVALPTSLEADTEYLLKDCVISGWGPTSLDSQIMSDVLLWTEVTVIPKEICEQFYDSAALRDKLCAANQNLAGLSGETGTGLHLRTPNGFKQIGILSLFGGKNKTRPGLYIKVASYIDWINIKALANN